MRAQQTADQQVEFSVSRMGPDSWRPSSRHIDGVRDRDLGIRAATHGRVSAYIVRTSDALKPEATWQKDAADCRILMPLSGEVTIEIEPGHETRIETETCVCLPGGMPYRITRYGSDLEILEVILGSDASSTCNTPTEAWSPMDDNATHFSISELGADSWNQGAGRREFLEWRNLGIGAATRGRLNMHGIRALKGEQGSTGWHYHTCELQVVHQLTGWGKLLFEPGQIELLDANTCVCIPPGTPHDEEGYSDDSKLIEITIGEIGTAQCEMPRSA